MVKKRLGNVWKLYKKDWRGIRRSGVTMFLVLSLMILPSLYAWFNIAALWDPYSNTSEIPIAVYSADKTTKVLEKQVNIGDDVIKNLKKNKKIGWRFVSSKKELEKGVKSGKYYAGLYLPADFSKNLVSFLNGEIKKPKIEYRVNQKINAIAPKVTDKGASSVKAEISEEFMGTVSKTVVKKMNQLGYDLDKNLPSIQKLTSKILTLNEKLPEIDGYTQKVLALQQKFPEYKAQLAKANELTAYLPEVDQLGQKILVINGKLPEIEKAGQMAVQLQGYLPDIQQAGKQIAQVDSDFDQIVQTMKDATSEAKQGLTVLQTAQNVLPDIEALAQTANASLPTIQKNVDSLKAALPQVAAAAKQILPVLQANAQAVSDLTDKAEDVTPTEIAAIQKQLASLNTSLTSMIQLLQALEKATGTTTLDGIISQLEQAKTLNDQLIAKSPAEIKADISQVHQTALQIQQLLAKVDADQLESQVNAALANVQTLLDQAGKVTSTLADQKQIDQLNALLTNTQSTLKQVIQFLDSYAAQLPALKQEIHHANEFLNGNMTSITDGINQAANLYTNEFPTLKKKLQAAASFVQNDWPSLRQEITSTLATLNQKMPEVETALNTASSLIKTDWPSLRQGIQKAASAIQTSQKDVDLGELIKLLKADANQESDFFENPVTIQQTDIYPIPNYGSASAPFYTALCLWVGAVLLVSLLATTMKLTPAEQQKYTKRQQFLARMGTFLTISFFQALIVELGNLFLLKAYTMNPIWEMAFVFLIGFTFVLMVYVLVALFGNIGKGIAIIILVLSISGGGGNFPIEMSGKFFQAIHPFLPFTYAVNLLREGVGGIYWPNAWQAILIMSSLFVIFFVGGYLLIPRMEKYLEKMNASLKKGNIVH